MEYVWDSTSDMGPGDLSEEFPGDGYPEMEEFQETSGGGYSGYYAVIGGTVFIYYHEKNSLWEEPKTNVVEWYTIEGIGK
jgi:hypothetical protein